MRHSPGDSFDAAVPHARGIAPGDSDRPDEHDPKACSADGRARRHVAASKSAAYFRNQRGLNMYVPNMINSTSMATPRIHTAMSSGRFPRRLKVNALANIGPQMN